MRTVGAATVAVSVLPCRTVRKSFRLGDQADHIHTETINAFFAPPVHHVKYRITHLRIIPVEIRLLLGKQMQIIHICLRIILPRRTAEDGSPVIRLTSVLFARTPYIEIAIWIVNTLTALHKPGVLVRCMIDNQIHHDLDTKFVRSCKHPVVVFHCSELCHNRLIITNVISIVIIR